MKKEIEKLKPNAKKMRDKKLQKVRGETDIYEKGRERERNKIQRSKEL